MSSNLENLRNSLTVLYVEPDAGLRRTTGSFLRRHYAEVITASEGSEAIEFMIKFHPKVILTEFQLGRINGLDFLKEIREFCPRSRVLFYTARPAEVSHYTGNFPVIPKRITGEDLVKKMDELLFTPKRRTRRSGD